MKFRILILRIKLRKMKLKYLEILILNKKIIIMKYNNNI